MKWTLFRVRFELLSGLHAGSFPVGNILKTRGYATGRMFWGAATASLVAHGLHPRTPDGFENAGKMTRESLRFGYLFPFDGEENGDRVPTEPLERTDEWEYRFLDTYSSTAIDYGEGSAEPGSLHEIEYIRSRTRPTLEVCSQAVTLFGHIAVRNSIQVSTDDADFFGVSLKAALSEIQLGGKRTYGFGRVRLGKVALGSLASTTSFFQGVFNPDGTVEWPAGQPVPAHVLMEGAPEPQSGKPEPFVGREWKEQAGFGAGQFVTPASLCWSPGTVFKSDDRQSFSFRIGHYGIWEAV